MVWSMSDKIAAMKSEEQIKARIKELSDKLKQMEARSRESAKERGTGRSNLAKPVIHNLKGQLESLEWVLLNIKTQTT